MTRKKTCGNKALRWQVDEFLPETGEQVSMMKFTSLFSLAKHYGISRNTASRLQLGELKLNQKRHAPWKNRANKNLQPELNFGKKTVEAC